VYRESDYDMLLAITTTYNPATDLGFLLHKNPSRCQSYDLSFGQVHVFYPVATDQECRVAVILDIDPVDMVRGKRTRGTGMPLEQYINDRPYVASSFLSVAIAQVFGSALKGQCKERPELLETVMPFTVRISVLPSRGGEQILHRLFEPLGYEVSAKGHELDEKFPVWGGSPYYTTTLRKDCVLSELLTHLYVLIPVLDNRKHYFIGKEEVAKLLKRGKGWLKDHPEREMIARRYLKYRTSLAREAIARLSDDDSPEIEDAAATGDTVEEDIESAINLNEERMGTVFAALKSSGAKSVVDLGCGEGKLLTLLLKDKQFEKITGMDVSIRSLEIAGRRLRLDSLAPMKRKRIELMHGSLMYRDKRFAGYDAATVMEVIEHLDAARLAAFERVLFEFARPETVLLTTPNREYNVVWDNLDGGKLRHGDHRFEWTRKEFQAWSNNIAERFDYKVRFLPIGKEEKDVGTPTQMAVFSR
jgi:3' terminal RNA ribose 2'-O-methyltransferase Hen1